MLWNACKDNRRDRTGEIFVNDPLQGRCEDLAALRVMDYEKKRDELQKISVLLSAKAGKTADAVDKMKNELMMTQAKLSEMSRKLMKIEADQLKDGNDKICWLRDGYDMTELRHFVNFALEEKRGKLSSPCQKV